MHVKFGKNTINLDISKKNLLGVLEAKNHPVESLSRLLKESIMNPIGKPRLRQLLRKNKPRDVVILVSDITRSISNYEEILQFLVAEIIDAGIDENNIEFIVTLGTHRKHTTQEQKFLYGDLVKNFRFAFHDCHNNLVSIGRTSTGIDVQVNKRVWDAEFVIATGRINLHYLAGFSGGRKSILPGISSYKTIQMNHRKLRRDGVALGELARNPIAQEMDEAARLFDLDYLLNVVETPEKEVAQIYCGDPQHAFGEGIQFFKKQRSVKISQKAHCVIVSAGGYPQDRDFFKSHKSLNAAINVIEPHGSVILVAQCSEGPGNENFLNYMHNNTLNKLLTYPEEKIEVGGHRAFVTARILKNYKVYVLSDLNSDVLSELHCTKISTLEDGVNIVKKNYGPEFKTYVIPDGESVLPVMDR